MPATQRALDVLGSQIAIACRELGLTAAELAERLGVRAQLVGRIENGAQGTAIGTVIEAEVLCGMPLFGVHPAEPADLAEQLTREVPETTRLFTRRVRSPTRNQRLVVSKGNELC